jgi:hypothetical protein
MHLRWCRKFTKSHVGSKWIQQYYILKKLIIFLFLKKHVFNKKQYFRHDCDQYEPKHLNNFIFWMSYLTDKNCSRAENRILAVHSDNKQHKLFKKSILHRINRIPKSNLHYWKYFNKCSHIPAVFNVHSVCGSPHIKRLFPLLSDTFKHSVINVSKSFSNSLLQTSHRR